MQHKIFAWHVPSDSFREVTEEFWAQINNGDHDDWINQKITARKDSDDDTSIWMFDVSLGGAFGNVVAGVVKVVKELQGELVIQ